MAIISYRNLLLSLGCLLAGCSTTPSSKGNWIGFVESGQASYYADRHQGQKTASGSIYQHNLKTAAHKKIPFGSHIKVTNINNGRSVIVTVNDRGPFAKRRIIDLSKSAFSSIGNTSSGVINVKIEVVR